MRAVWVASVASAALCASICGALDSCGADRIILRDLTILGDRSVVSFDEDGVRLDDDTTLTWDRIERGSVSSDKQAAFDQLRDEIGRPLFQLRVRLRVGDDLGLVEPAERLAARFAERDGASAYLVQRALMRARLATGRREGAVEPYLRCLAQLWNAPQAASSPSARAAELPIELRMRVDPDTGLSLELLPVLFEATAAQAALPGVRQAALRFAEPRPDALRIYFAALAAAAGDAEAAERSISGIAARDGSPEAERRAADWRDVLRLAMDYRAASGGPALTQLAARLDSLSPLCRPVAYHWTGLARLQSSDVESQMDGVLTLLHLPARFGSEQPDLAAAALATAADALEKLGDATGAAALRRERISRYARTRALRQGPPANEGAAPRTADPPTSERPTAKDRDSSAPDSSS